MCTLLFIFCNLSRKTFDCSRNNILRSANLLFPCSEELFASHSFPWKTYKFSISFWFKPIKLRFSAKTLQQNCQICIICCPQNTPMKNSFTEKVTILLHFFRILSQKNLDFSKIVSAVLSKLHISFPLNTFRYNRLVKRI